MGRPQFGFPRLRVVTGREAGIAVSPDDAPPSYGADGIFSGLPHFLAGSVCANQAEAVRNFLMVISSFARNQSSSS
jgi:hypothetical protein